MLLLQSSTDPAYFMIMIFIVVLAFVIQVAIIRWVLRINTIVELLEQIRYNTEKQKPNTSEQNKLDKKTVSIDPNKKCICSICVKTYPTYIMKTLETGQLACPECFSKRNIQKGG